MSSCAQAVEALAASVETFDGGVVVVSHDQYFVSRTHTAQFPQSYHSYSASLCGDWNFLMGLCKHTSGLADCVWDCMAGMAKEVMLVGDGRVEKLESFEKYIEAAHKRAAA